MSIEKDLLQEDGPVFDVIVAGGGVSGCVVAARLTELYPELSILLLEAGKESSGDPVIEEPLTGLFSVFAGAETLKFVQSKPSKYLAGRTSVEPVANVLGGGSCVNFMFYNNAAASDFDDWEQPGWDFEALDPLIRKTLSFHGFSDDPARHGTKGPMQVSKYLGWKTNAQEGFFSTMKEMGELPYLEDMADFKQGEGYGPVSAWIDLEGRRSNAFKAYIGDRKLARSINAYGAQPVPARPGLHVVTSATIVKLLFNDQLNRTRATGVEVCASPSSVLDQEQSNTQHYHARRQIVLSAGAFGSPTILQRSGVGNSDVLSKLGIEIKADLPGVGREYQDHQRGTFSFAVDSKISTLDPYFDLSSQSYADARAEWLETGRGPLSTNGLQNSIKMRPTKEEMLAMGPEFTEYWTELGLNKPDKPLVTVGFMAGHLGKNEDTRPGGRYMNWSWWNNYPGSRGRLQISSTNPFAPPDFESGLLNHPGDLQVQVWVYKRLRAITERLPYYRGHLLSTHPEFDETSPAAPLANIDPTETPSAKVNGHANGHSVTKYSKADDEAIHRWVRERVGTTWHSMTTCPMRPREDGGVVDADLNVYGIQSVKVADLSICPKNLGTNTTSVALVIGEKCAEILSNEWLVEGVKRL